MTLQKKATIVSSTIAAILVIIKLIVGFISGSVALLASAIDSLLDMFVSIFNLFAITQTEKPADETFNYGRGKVEAIASVIEGTIITISGLFILYQSIDKAISGEITTYLGSSILVMIISLILTIFLVLFLNYVAKKTNSMVIRADSLHYKSDVLANSAILISLIVIYFSNFHLIDSIIGGLIAIYIIYSAYELIKNGVLMLLDVALDSELVKKIEEIIKKQNEVSSYHYLKTRESGKVKFVDVHLVFNPSFSLVKAHNISDIVENEISNLDKNSEWVITIHLDPYNDALELHKLK